MNSVGPRQGVEEQRGPDPGAVLLRTSVVRGTGLRVKDLQLSAPRRACGRGERGPDRRHSRVGTPKGHKYGPCRSRRPSSSHLARQCEGQDAMAWCSRLRWVATLKAPTAPVAGFERGPGIAQSPPDHAARTSGTAISLALSAVPGRRWSSGSPVTRPRR